MSNHAATSATSSDKTMELLLAHPALDIENVLATYTTTTVIGNETVTTVITLEKLTGEDAAFTHYPVTRYIVSEPRRYSLSRKSVLIKFGFDVEFSYNAAALLVQEHLDAAAGLVIR